MSLYLRSNERGRSPKEVTRVGIRVTYLNGVVHFFPAATYALGMILVNTMVPQEHREHPATVIEFGEKVGPVWVPSRVIKAGIKKE